MKLSAQSLWEDNSEMLNLILFLFQTVSASTFILRYFDGIKTVKAIKVRLMLLDLSML